MFWLIYTSEVENSMTAMVNAHVQEAGRVDNSPMTLAFL